MRPSLLMPIACISLLGQSGPAWTTFLDGLRQRAQGEDRWTLLVRGAGFEEATWQQDDLFLRLQLNPTFRLQRLGATDGGPLWNERGWREDQQHWFFISPDGVIKDEGDARPSPADLLDRMRRAGFVPRWEQREAFLKEHPDHGEARMDAVREASSLAMRRISALFQRGRLQSPTAPQQQGPSGPRGLMRFGNPDDAQNAQLAEQTYKDAGESLERLLQVPGWEEEDMVPSLLMPFRVGSAVQSTQMKALADRMAAQLKDHLQQDPHSERGWRAFAMMRVATGGEVLQIMQQMTPVPGQPWPPEGALQMVEEHFAANQDWEGLLTFLQSAPDIAPDPGGNADAWRRATNHRARMEVARARALAKLDRWKEVDQAIEAVRTWSGSQWATDFRRRIRQSIPELRAAERRAAYDRLLATEPLPDPKPAPAVPPARLVLLGKPTWIADWERLRKQAPLAPWGPGELIWEQAAVGELAKRFAWTDIPDWALIQGETCHATGKGCPEAKALAASLAPLGPTRLQRLDAILRTQPEHLAAHRARVELLTPRMPNPHLEVMLAESARLSMTAPRAPLPKGWKPEPQLWEWAAMQVLPKREAELCRWPSRVALWRSWLAWSRFHPSHPTPITLAQNIPVWGDATRWKARLPKEVHEAVADELRVMGRFEDMRAWFQEAWDGLDHRPWRGRGGGGAFFEARKEQGDVIIRPLKEALSVLKRYQELKALELAYEAYLAVNIQTPNVTTPRMRGGDRGETPMPGDRRRPEGQ